ncbi:hypothetical protein [Paraburkholderia antibiotica]|uniref:hypothetical protein n=1 Tax=Paraburkholderia antibiotica TaxID=2728839 RepID=UPI001E572AD2|nr:hypothetical protein [Paraburkholderia antibiotica]
MAAPALSEAHAKAVHSATRRSEGKRVREIARERAGESQKGRASTRGPLSWANFIEILIGVVSTDVISIATAWREFA